MFIRNAWYVAAWVSEIQQAPLARTFLGEPVVLFRRASGTVAALEDRCCHRGLPLSLGEVRGETIVCGYHGISYEGDGKCAAIPGQSHVSARMRIRSYAVVERDELVWIWMGDLEAAQKTPLPPAQWMLDGFGWATSYDYFSVNSSYVFLHENLVDLSHLTFLHANTFGTPDYAGAPFETEITDDAIVVRRTVQPTRLPPIYAIPLGMQNVDAARIVTSTFLTPGLSVSAVVLRNLEQPVESHVDHHIRTAQLLTPCDRRTVHYHFIVARDFAIGDYSVSDFILEGIKAAFVEDVFALESITRVRAEDPDIDFKEKSIAYLA